LFKTITFLSFYMTVMDGGVIIVERNSKKRKNKCCPR